MERLMTAVDIQKALSISRGTAIELMREMNPINVGTGATTHLRVRQSEYELWLKRRQVMVVEPVPIERTRKKRKPEMASATCDEYGRCLRKRNGKLVPLKTQPRHSAG